MNGLSAALLIVAGLGVAALVLGRLATSARREWSDADYESVRRRRSSGVLAASMQVLGENLHGEAAAAAEARRALEEHEADEASASGEGNSPAPRRSGRPPASPIGC